MEDDFRQPRRRAEAASEEGGGLRRRRRRLGPGFGERQSRGRRYEARMGEEDALQEQNSRNLEPIF